MTNYLSCLQKKIADLKGINFEDRRGYTTLNIPQYSCSKLIGINKKTTKKNKCKKDVALVDAVRGSTNSSRLFEDPAINVSNKVMDDKVFQQKETTFSTYK
ncbi:hypothetical protein NPIL_439011 [Nephila pilipes]|uniref:Uncharacterized protein n=1 Tax=Nephila pilipes TaxID=299642 RepID=A0A8X6PKL3_NEPPI|nr:hypothetical protein NPIL_439011 [Nephila pilipes]